MNKTNDAFYRRMTDNELQATYKEIEANLKYDKSRGMQIEKELIQHVAEERGITLGNQFDAIKGFIEYGAAKQVEEEFVAEYYVQRIAAYMRNKGVALNRHDIYFIRTNIALVRNDGYKEASKVHKDVIESYLRGGYLKLN